MKSDEIIHALGNKFCFLKALQDQTAPRIVTLSMQTNKQNHIRSFQLCIGFHQAEHHSAEGGPQADEDPDSVEDYPVFYFLVDL